MDDRPWFEPLGLLSGFDAHAAVAAGAGRWLAGGPLAFTMVRLEHQTLALSDVPAAWRERVGRLSAALLPDWAGSSSPIAY